ncbi:MAG TPA: peptidase MA family metallohydrolase, partial [Anaerolineales bacterium]|nr:peptidase MA family metallohydrolase [Anaerolineales bacterium]
MQRSSLFLLLAWITLGFTRAPQAPPALDVSGITISYDFGKQITFSARLASPIPITQATISFRDANEANTRVEPLTLNPDGSTTYQYDASQNVIPPFAIVLFSYQATLADGETVTSGLFNFKYEDNRFTWKSLSDGPIGVHWAEGDDAFGHAALDAARAGLEKIEQTVTVSLDAPLDIYIYPTANDLQSALTLGGKQWIAGHADPSLGVVMVSVAPGDTQAIELQRQVPHELAHVMLYRSLGTGYSHLPAWLNEGIASTAELYPNPDYVQALKAAGASDSLIPFPDLCASFPADSGRAFLAYAESESFVRYLRDTYGNTGLVALTRA